MSNTWFLQDLLGSIAEQGRALLPKALFRGDTGEGLQTLVMALMSGRGEASGVAIAQQLIRHYRQLKADEKVVFFRYIARALKPDQGRVEAAARGYTQNPTPGALARLQAAVESPRQEFFRRLNLAPGATGEIVAMRRDLLDVMRGDEELEALDSDIRHLLQSWFNRGFLVLRRIDWHTPAVILEKIIAYEAVHEIHGWDDLRRRLDPADRRCFAFFHPNLVDEPLIFVEVALMDDTPEAISEVLREARKTGDEDAAPTTAVFYSISNCQAGLRGISFGNFLIKQVAEELAREVASLKTFVTLSPAPGFGRFVARLVESDADGVLTDKDRDVVQRWATDGWHAAGADAAASRATGLALAAHYYLAAKTPEGRPLDAVARFHLGNGARLERLNWLGDTSAKGLAEAHGLMVNYRYELKEIERNHEAYANDGTIAASRAVRGLLRASTRRQGDKSGGGDIGTGEGAAARAAVAAVRQLAAPVLGAATPAGQASAGPSATAVESRTSGQGGRGDRTR